MKKVNFYIDGFNFYFGLKEMCKHKPDWRKFYWIDIVKLCNEFLNENEEIGEVHYFTARPKNKGKTTRQNMLMSCNKAINGEKFKIHYGKYQDKPMICRAEDGCGKSFMHWEEKQTDVNLAIKMIETCHYDECNKIVLISGDSDFLPPLKLIKNFYKEKDLLVMFPPTKYTNSISENYYTMDNVTTANTMNDVVTYLYDHKEDYKVLIKNMEEAEPGEYLDRDTQLSMPQKYGMYDSALNSVGFVECNTSYSIVVLTSLGDKGADVMANINRIAYEHFK